MESVDAFTDAAAQRARVARHPGRLLPAEEADAAADALDVLVDPANLIQTTVDHPRGARGSPRSSTTLAEKTDFPPRPVRRGCSTQPGGARAAGVRQGQPGGLPVPGDLRASARSRRRSTCSRQMVDRWQQAADGRSTSRPRPQALGYTPARGHDDREPGRGRGAAARTTPKIARVIYNRLESNGTNGRSRSTPRSTTRSTASRRRADHRRGASQLDSPYNTYKHTGLPPGPIELARRRGDRGGAAPGGRRLVLLRDGQPAHRRDQVRRTATTSFLKYKARVPASTARPVRRLLRT